MSDDKKVRRSTRRLFDLLELARDALAPYAAPEGLRIAQEWFGRFFDLGREMERQATIEERMRKEEAERKLEAAQQELFRLRACLRRDDE